MLLTLSTLCPIAGQASALPTASLLTLAGRLMDRALDRTPPGAFTFEMLLVVLDVLLASGQHARAAALLEGSRARKACTSPTDLSFLCAAVAAGAGEQEAAARRCREVLTVSPHDWAAARLCLDCLLAQEGSGRTLRCRWPVWVVGGLTDTLMEREPGSQEDQTAPEPLGEVQRRVLADWSDEWGSNLPPFDCSGSASPGPLLRATHLALLDGLARGLTARHAEQVSTEPSGPAEKDLAKQVSSAFRALSTLGNVVLDLGPYLAILRGAEAQSLADEAKAIGEELWANSSEAGNTGTWTGGWGLMTARETCDSDEHYERHDGVGTQSHNSMFGKPSACSHRQEDAGSRTPGAQQRLPGGVWNVGAYPAWKAPKRCGLTGEASMLQC